MSYPPITKQEPFDEKFADLFSFHSKPKQDYKPSLFSISDIAHYEDILTNWYAFFFSTVEEHGFRRLFLDAICNLITLQRELPPDFMNGGCIPLREYYTNKGNRIDLLLYDEKPEKERYYNAIIIENKLYHHLHNDLEDYYNTVAIVKEGYKMGVLLSLYPVANLNANFVNITHKQFLNKVLELMPQYWLTAGDKYLIYLKDLAQNINQLTSDITMDKNIRFYFDNVVKFHELEQIMEQSATYVYNQIKITADRLGLKSSGNNDNYRYIYSNEVKDIYYIILLDDLFKTGNSISVAIELTGKKTIGMLGEFDRSCQELPVQQHVDMTTRPCDRDYWLYYALVKYPITLNDIEELGNFLYDNIQNDLENIRMKLFEISKSCL